MLWMGRRCQCWIGLLQLKNVAGNMQVHNVYLLIGFFAYWGVYIGKYFMCGSVSGGMNLRTEGIGWTVRHAYMNKIEQVQQLHAVLATSTIHALFITIAVDIHSSNLIWQNLDQLEVMEPGFRRHPATRENIHPPGLRGTEFREMFQMISPPNRAEVCLWIWSNMNM